VSNLRPADESVDGRTESGIAREVATISDLISLARKLEEAEPRREDSGSLKPLLLVVLLSATVVVLLAARFLL